MRSAPIEGDDGFQHRSQHMKTGYGQPRGRLIGVPVAVLSATIRGRFVPTTQAATLGFRCAADDSP